MSGMPGAVGKNWGWTVAEGGESIGGRVRLELGGFSITGLEQGMRPLFLATE